MCSIRNLIVLPAYKWANENDLFNDVPYTNVPREFLNATTKCMSFDPCASTRGCSLMNVVGTQVKYVQPHQGERCKKSKALEERLVLSIQKLRVVRKLNYAQVYAYVVREKERQT